MIASSGGAHSRWDTIQVVYCPSRTGVLSISSMMRLKLIAYVGLLAWPADCASCSVSAAQMD